MAKDSNPFERLVEQLADSMVQSVEAVPEMPPAFAVKLSEREQVQQYLELGDDPAKWTALIQRHGLGPTLQYAQRMQRLAETYSGSGEQPPGLDVLAQ